MAEEQRALQDVEAQRQLLIVGNQENTEQRLKDTKEDGVLKMSISSIWKKLIQKSERTDPPPLPNNMDRAFIASKMDSTQTGEINAEDFSQDKVLDHLEIIKAYIEGFDTLCTELAKPIEQADGKRNKDKETYFKLMTDSLAEMAETNNTINLYDFTQFDPASQSNR